MSTKIIAIIAAVTVCTAGVGIAWMHLSSDDYVPDYSNVAPLMIFGNANNDNSICEDDILFIQKIINDVNDGKMTMEEALKEYPLADANLAGVIDEESIKTVEKMISISNQIKSGVSISSIEKMNVNYFYKHGNEMMTDYFLYPINTICVVGGSHVTLPATLIGAIDRIVARDGGSLDARLYPEITAKPTISGDVMSADFEQIMQLIADGNKIDAIITADNAVYVTNWRQFQDAGVKVIRVSAGNDGAESLSGILTMGWMLGLEEGSKEYVEYASQIFDAIRERIDTIPMEDRVKAFAVTMTAAVAASDSSNTAMTVMAGAINLADWTGSTQNFRPDLGDVWLLNERYHTDYIIHLRGWGYDSTPSIANPWVGFDYFKDTEAGKAGNYVVINSNMPWMLVTLYVAHIFYPDKITAAEVNDLHQEFVDKYLSHLGVDYKVGIDGTFIYRNGGPLDY